MKLTKSILIIGITAITGLTCAYAAMNTKFSSKFIKNFKDCDPYQETISSEFEGKSFVTQRKIIGWSNGYCKYEEVIKSQDDIYKINCNFSSIQVDELYASMKANSKETMTYNLESFVERIDEKTGKSKYVVAGTTTIKGNKALITWAKYQNNPYFCKPEKLK